jgi:hypothetical protein
VVAKPLSHAERRSLHAQALIKQRFDTDPLNWYRPGKTQQRCYESQTLYRLITGANQTGKTAHAVIECAALARGRHPYKQMLAGIPLEILVVVPSRAQAVGVWGMRLLKQCKMASPDNKDIWKHPLIPRHEIKRVHNNSSGSGPAPGRIELLNGSNIWFAWSGDDDQWERIQGFTFDFIFRDEGSGNSKLGEELYLRLVAAQTTKAGAGGILWSATPTLINDEFDQYRKRCRKAQAHYEEFFIQPNENPAVSAEVRERMRGSLSLDAQQIRLDGTTSAMELAQVYGRQWNDVKHIVSPDYQLGLTDNLWVSMDPGFDHPWGTGIFAINAAEPRKLRGLAYIWTRRTTRRENLELVRDWLRGRKVEGVVVDPASYKTESNGKSLYTQIEEDMQELDIQSHRGLMTSRNRHEGGIEMVQQYLEDGLIQFNLDGPGCGQAIAEMIGYMGRPETRYTGTHGVIKKNDEFPDLLRYLVMHEPVYTSRGPNYISPEFADNGLQVYDVSAPPPEDMSEDERTHRQRLELSARLVDAVKRPARGLPEGRLSFA